MAIYFMRYDGVSLAQRRGLETIDLNLLYILVKAPVEPVAQAFSTLRQMNVWVPDAYGREIDILNESIFVFRLRGHPWSIVYKPLMPVERLYLNEEDARIISELLGTSAIFYGGSDTCATIEYYLFSNGIAVEKLFFEEDGDIKFQSQLRQIKAEDIEDAYQFTMDFVREQDAYIPGIVQVEDLIVGQCTILRIEDLLPDEIEQMDYLAQQ